MVLLSLNSDKLLSVGTNWMLGYPKIVSLYIIHCVDQISQETGELGLYTVR